MGTRRVDGGPSLAPRTTEGAVVARFGAAAFTEEVERPSEANGSLDAKPRDHRVRTHLHDAAPASPLKERDAIVGGQRP